MELDLSAIDVREEVAADQRRHEAAQREHQRGGERNDEAPLKQHREHAHIAAAKQLESMLEALVQAREGVARPVGFAVVLALEQQADHDRRQGPREGIGREHSEHHGKPERREQEASVETMVGTAIPAEPCRVAAARLMPSPRSR